MISNEQRYILDSVVDWFNRPDQIRHYQDEALAGPTEAERALLSGLPATGSVLDVGCGAGRLSMWLARQGLQVTGIDVSDDLLQVARQLSARSDLTIDYQSVSGVDALAPGTRFDHAICFKVLCYIPTKELRHQYLCKLYQWIEPGGTCLLTQYIVPDEYIDDAVDEDYYKSPASQFAIVERGDSFPQAVGYVRWFTEQELWNELKSSPFKIVRSFSDEPYGGAGLTRLFELKRETE